MPVRIFKVSNHHAAIAKVGVDLMAFTTPIFIVANGNHLIV